MTTSFPGWTESELTQLSYLAGSLVVCRKRRQFQMMLDGCVEFNGPFPENVRRAVDEIVAELPEVFRPGHLYELCDRMDLKEETARTAAWAVRACLSSGAGGDS